MEKSIKLKFSGEGELRLELIDDVGPFTIHFNNLELATELMKYIIEHCEDEPVEIRKPLND
jgi:hypothetical protein